VNQQEVRVRSSAKKQRGIDVPSLSDEFRDAELGDLRRTVRLASMVEAFGASHGKSIPEIARDDAELQAIYRFLNNDAVDPVEMLVPHFQETARRAENLKTALVIHDITKILYEFDGDEREGLRRMGNQQGFNALPALMLSGDGDNQPLGLAALDTWTHDAQETRSKRKRPPRSWGRVPSDRWLNSVTEAARYARGSVRRIHVIDSEAEGYRIFFTILQRDEGFVIRFRKQRNVALDGADEFINVTEAADKLDGVFELGVPISARKATRNGRHADRDARMARLTFSAARVDVKKAWNLKSEPEIPERLSVNLVVVRELEPPAGQEAVEWLLATSEPIETVEDVKRVVAIYKARWTVEEFFRVLKTGCRLEGRQIESLAALQRLLAIFVVNAWRILLLRHVARFHPDAPAETALSPAMLLVLRATGRRPLSSRPTVAEALLAVAALGGHIKNNGPPGCVVLYRGMERLLERTYGFLSMAALVGAAKM
jgi:hypothetical protein